MSVPASHMTKKPLTHVRDLYVPSNLPNIYHSALLNDGASNSTVDNGNAATAPEEEFDEVERGEETPLAHLTAGRAKAPRRRLPTQHLRNQPSNANAPSSPTIKVHNNLLLTKTDFSNITRSFHFSGRENDEWKHRKSSQGAGRRGWNRGERNCCQNTMGEVFNLNVLFFRYVECLAFSGGRTTKSNGKKEEL